MSAIGTKLDFEQVIKQAYDEPKNRIRVDAEVTATIGKVEVEIDAADGDNIAISDGTNTASVDPNGGLNVNVLNDLELSIDAATGDNIAISDGTNTATVTPGGALNVNIVNPAASIVTINQYNEITSVPSAILSTILSYTALSNGKIKQVNVSGNNKAIYTVIVNASTIDKAYTYYNEFTVGFNFGEGLSVLTGQQVSVAVIHDRPFLGNFNARLQFIED